MTAREYIPGPHDRITLDATDDLPPDSLDEIVLTGVDVHLERMSTTTYSLNVYVGEGASSLLGQFWVGELDDAVVVTLSHLNGEHVDRIPEVQA